jgi:hypothetical protein
METTNIKTAKDLLKEVVRTINLKSVDPDSLVNFFAELMDLESKKLTWLEVQLMNAKVDRLKRKYSI